MDPMSGLSLAVNIIQLLDVATRIVSAGYAVSKGADGFTDENREAVEIASDLELLVVSLRQSETDWIVKHGATDLDANEIALRGLCEGCQDVARELIRRLHSLRPHGKFRGLAIIRTSLLIVWKKDEIEQYSSRLQTYRAEVNTRLLAGLREHLKAIDRDLDSRFTNLDANTRKIALAILDQRDVFSEKLDVQQGLLENIRSNQEKTNSLLVALTQEKFTPSPSPSPSPMLTPFGSATPDPETSPYPLHKAAREGDAKSIRRLLASPMTDVNGVDEHGSTALHFARDADAAERLANGNANVNTEDFEGRTPLIIAIIDRRLDVVILLLAKNAKKDIRDDLRKSAMDHAADCPAATYLLKHGWQPKHRNAGLLHMAWLGDMEGVVFFLNQGADVNAKAKDGDTALHSACHNGDLDIVRLLLDRGADMEATNSKRWRPILLANLAKRLHIMRELVLRGADIEARSPLGRSLVSAACTKSNWKVVRMLVDRGANLSLQDKQGYTALHFVVHKERVDMIRFLIDKGAPLNVRDGTGETPLYAACTQGNAEIVEVLLQRGADPSIPSHLGFTPLSLSANKNSVTIAKILLKYKADPSQAGDPSKTGSFTKTPLAEAAELGHLEMARLLLDNQADVNAKSDLRRRPLHLAILREPPIPDMIDVLLSAGAHVEAADKNGMTPLALASYHGNLNAVRRLLDSAVNTESIAKSPRASNNDSGFTPLMLSVMNGSGTLEITRALIERNTNLDARTVVAGDTALLLSIENEAFDAAVALIEAGANVSFAGVGNPTPLMAAAEAKAIEVVQKLLQYGADPNVRDGDGCTAWIRAKHAGSDHALKHLLGPKTSTDVETQDENE